MVPNVCAKAPNVGAFAALPNNPVEGDEAKVRGDEPNAGEDPNAGADPNVGADPKPPGVPPDHKKRNEILS